MSVHRSWVARGAFATLALWIALPVLLHLGGFVRAAALVELPFAFVCHQIPERVVHVASAPMPLCSRCLGLWGGLAIAATVAYPRLSIRTLRIVVPATAALLVGEGLTQELGFHSVCHLTRVLSGLCLSVPIGGAIGGFISAELTSVRSGQPA